MKKNIIVLLIVGITAAGLLFYLVGNFGKATKSPQNGEIETPKAQNFENEPPRENISAENEAIDEMPTIEEPAEETRNRSETSIGKSVQGRDILAYHFGSGDREILLVGGIHGGYAWNTALLGYQIMDYLKTNPSAIPANIKVTVIPVLNPDGLNKVIGITGPFKISDVSSSQDLKITGRFNANNVDLNRNFDCGWLARGVWQSKTVSGGTAAFSEPESAAIKKFILEEKPAAVIFWHSKSGTVYGSSCGNGMLDETVDIMNAYAKAADYAAAPTFDQYTVSGDATDWLASIGIPAITVELKTHENIEWPQNLAGVQSLFKYYETKK
jgi:hypothetical protein